MATSQISSVFHAFRPKTLSAAVIPVVVGSAASLTIFGEFDPVVFGCALLSALLIQIGTNLANDAADFLKGADRQDRKGPTRLAQSKTFEPKTIFMMAGVAFLIALLFGIPLVKIGGWPVVAVGLCSILLGFGYTMGPFPLAYVGLGDLFVILFFGLVAVGTTMFLHTGVWSPEALVLGLQVGFLSTVLIGINNLRDIDEDARAGKKTLAVRLGKKLAKWQIAIVIYAPYLMCTYWLIPHYSHAAVLPFFALSISVPLMNQIFETEPSEIYNQYLAKASLHSIVFCALLIIGLFLA